MSDTVNLEKLKKAQAIFEDFRNNLTTHQNKAGAVQAFEFSYEMAWKIMKRVLATRGIESGSPRDVFRKAAQDNIIYDPETWFDFLDKRSLTMDIYDEEILEEVVSSFEVFSRELSKLISKQEDQSIFG